MLGIKNAAKILQVIAILSIYITDQISSTVVRQQQTSTLSPLLLRRYRFGGAPGLRSNRTLWLMYC